MDHRLPRCIFSVLSTADEAEIVAVYGEAVAGLKVELTYRGTLLTVGAAGLDIRVPD